MELLTLNLRATWGRAYVRVVGASRELSWLVFEVTLPVLGTAAYVYVYRGLNAPPEFVGFVLLGGAMTAFWMNVLWSMASQLFWEKESSNLEAFFLAPCSRMAILVGMAAGGMYLSLVRAVSILVLGSLLFGVRFPRVEWVPVVGAFVLALLALYGLGMLLASLYLVFGREAWHVSNLLQEPIYLLSGFYFPVRALGPWVGLAASLIPLTFGLDAMRQLIWAEGAMGLLPVGTELAVLGAEAVVFLLAAYKALHVMERMAVREGRLTLKWQ
ncbi:ABC transporter permease [Limnochorda pilosa]|uniref:Transport permease protein n=1 Tax=Limnochorda pilosa TaxID=1555112 RepID=A0A0K2SQ86_LIMPI|nr:ABC transporter permease [Limnochorda pilosa]